MTRFCVDTSAWVDAELFYDPTLPVFREFWSSLAARIATGEVMAPEEVLRELAEKEVRKLGQWLDEVRSELSVAPTAEIQKRYKRIVNEYPDLIRKGKPYAKSDGDAWVIALAEQRRATVVSAEKPKPSAPQPRKIPDVCAARGIEHIDLPTFVQRLHRRPRTPRAIKGETIEDD